MGTKQAGANQVSTIKAITRRELEIKCLEYRKAGLSYHEILAQPDVPYKSHTSVYRAVMRCLDRMQEEPTRKVRLLELARIDGLLKVWWPRAVGSDIDGAKREPDLNAAKYVLELLQRRHRMLGVDAPLKVDLTGMVQELAAALGLDVDQAMEEAGVLVRQALSQPNQN